MMNDEAETKSAEDSAGSAEAAPPRVRRSRKRRPFWVHPLLWLVELVGGLVALALLCVGMLALRLEWGPIELGFLKPELVAWLNAEADPLQVEIDRTALSWVTGRSTAELVASGVSCHRSFGHLGRDPAQAVGHDRAARPARRPDRADPHRAAGSGPEDPADGRGGGRPRSRRRYRVGNHGPVRRTRAQFAGHLATQLRRQAPAGRSATAFEPALDPESVGHGR